LKGKLKVLVSKLATNKKEKEALSKQNEELQQEVLTLQNNLRHMVAGFNNTTSQFPMMN
jgi:FtsZ-binding cell division protein ZapB